MIDEIGDSEELKNPSDLIGDGKYHQPETLHSSSEITRAIQSTVRIEDSNGHLGSGVLVEIAQKIYLVTVAHVVALGHFCLVASTGQKINDAELMRIFGGFSPRDFYGLKIIAYGDSRSRFTIYKLPDGYDLPGTLLESLDLKSPKTAPTVSGSLTLPVFCPSFPNDFESEWRVDSKPLFSFGECWVGFNQDAKNWEVALKSKNLKLGRGSSGAGVFDLQTGKLIGVVQGQEAMGSMHIIILFDLLEEIIRVKDNL